MQGVGYTANDAMAEFARRRSHTGNGVTGPSQRRYVGYIEQICRQVEPTTRPVALTSVRLSCVPSVSYVCVLLSEPYLSVMLVLQILYLEDSELRQF